MAHRVFLPFAALAMIAVPLAAQAATEPPAATQQAEVQSNARIPFADSIGVWNWQSRGDSTLYFQDNHRQWYKAELFAPAPDLPFTQYIGLDTGPTGTLDKFSSVYIHGERYPLVSFVKIEGAPPAD